MKKVKFIESEERKQYKRQLEELQRVVNPKPSLEEQERLRKEYLARRGEKE